MDGTDAVVYSRLSPTLALVAGLGKSLLPVFIYDYFLILEAEITHIWVPGHKRASAWFLFVRYFTLFSNITMALTTFGTFTPEELVVGCTLILRVYAMYSFNKRILACLLTMGLVTLGVGVWSVLPAGPPITGITLLPDCQIPESHTQLACDTMILGLTVYRAFQTTRGALAVPGSLFQVMMRDGAMYFSSHPSGPNRTIADRASGHLSVYGWFSKATVTLCKPPCTGTKAGITRTVPDNFPEFKCNVDGAVNFLRPTPPTWANTRKPATPPIKCHRRRLAGLSGMLGVHLQGMGLGKFGGCDGSGNLRNL
ncbi:hypothetical protein B0H17DRAFT_1129798 [Mycena rosella]|uniref:DUF6533 domain-containing protein n=1 Tax=Mycena rosella TaxID=1033263 RepID=A0AAD7GPP6_MYCRO|nr:hypothetical protein B0H17DRAFT_1129798 [Mycena rosella]